jgi:hypothetical protein
MKQVLPVLLLAGCTSVSDDRVCLDWKNSIEMVKECTPLYGNLVCVTKEKPRYWCVLYDESSTEQQNLHGSNPRVSKGSLGRTYV